VRSRPLRVLTATALAALGLAGPATPAEASHEWNGYHWARTDEALTLRIGDNVSEAWDGYLATTSADWSRSDVLDTRVVPGATWPRGCRPTSGRVEVCSARYGDNGWLGIARIWVDGRHITRGVVRLNDTYFQTSRYNRPAWRALVSCQEVGHTLGLEHQDEDPTNPNLDTCMDYTNRPFSNQHPNQHDYDQLSEIYEHLDDSSTLGKPSPSPVAATGPAGSYWGQALHRSSSGRGSLYVRDLGANGRVFTFVTWA
jgi:hypothetical protein